MSKFGGRYDITMDEKTRVFIPAELRSEFDGKAVICKPLNEMHCIFIYTKAEWDAFFQRSLQIYKGKSLVVFKTFLNSTMSEVTVDKYGRLTLGQDFADFADLTRDIAMVGAETHLQLWNRDVLNKTLESESDSFDASMLEY